LRQSGPDTDDDVLPDVVIVPGDVVFTIVGTLLFTIGVRLDFPMLGAMCCIKAWKWVILYHKPILPAINTTMVTNTSAVRQIPLRGRDRRGAGLIGTGNADGSAGSCDVFTDGDDSCTATTWVAVNLESLQAPCKAFAKAVTFS